MLRPHIAARQDLQRREKLLAEIILAAADAGERRRRADHRAVADLDAVIGFDAPDGGDEMAVDAIGLLDRVEDLAMLREHRAAILDARVVDQDIEIVPERFGELGLGVHQIHDPQIRRQTRRIRVEDRARDAAPLGLRPEPAEAAAEIGRRRANGRGRHQGVTGGAGFAAPFRGCRRGRGGGRRRRRDRAGGGGRRVEERADVETLAEHRVGQGGGSQGRGAKEAHRSGKSRHGARSRSIVAWENHGEPIWLRDR